MRTINASDFKARCLAIFDEVAAGGEPISITKRGRPVAQLTGPAPDPDRVALIGSVEILGDIMEPVLGADAWDAQRGQDVALCRATPFTCAPGASRARSAALVRSWTGRYG